jgi:pimeloyl-ACP methyl ester carboxylesterase
MPSYIQNREMIRKEVKIAVDSVVLDGELTLPAGATGIVLFAHGSGSSRHSTRNIFVAEVIQAAGVGTLLFDLLSADEEAVDIYTRHLRFDIGLLGRRLIAAANFVGAQPETKDLNIGFFGASTGGAAAIVAAVTLGDAVKAVVSRGGRPDLAGDQLLSVRSPVLLIVGGRDDVVIKLNQEAFEKLNCEKQLEIVPGATHLFEEPGTLEAVAKLAANWFRTHLRKADAIWK